MMSGHGAIAGASAAVPPVPDGAGLIKGLPHAAWLVALDTLVVVAANDAAGQLFGRDAESLVGEDARGLAASPEDLAWWLGAECGELSPLYSDTLVATPDGRALHVTRSICAVPSPGSAHAPTHALVMLQDRSAAHHADQEREALLSDLQATLEATADGILVTDLSGRIRAFNRRFAQLWALPVELLLQQDSAAVQGWMRRSVAEPQAYDERLRALGLATLVVASDRLQLLSGPVLERVTRPLFQAGRPQGRVWSFRDLTERLAQEERIESLSLSDVMTGLPNRRRLSDAVGDAARRMRDGAGQGFALLVIDMDRFCQINDSLGQTVGDQVLLEVSQRIQGALRQDDMLARLGSDQFAVLLHQADGPAAEAAARRILRVVAEPCQVEGTAFTLTCSIGVALAPSHGSTADDLVRHAESAMRQAKAAGRAGYRLYQVRAEGDRRWQIRLDHAMRQALVSGRFRLAYQPQVCLRDGRLVGAEALLRWRDPELGEVSPGRFIPVAEETGFIVELGDWVLSQAVRQAALWHQRGHTVPVAVNVSALQFQRAHFVDRVANLLAVSGMPAHLLELELTESILVHDAEETLRRLHALSALGLRMAIDDFGTGYSSLSYLKRFPIGKLKIDRSFVQGLPGDEGDAGIVRAILQMAGALHMQVIAEGVETEAQRRFLSDAGCDQFQGFLFAPALDALGFEDRLAVAGPGSIVVPDAVQPVQPRRGHSGIRLVRG